MKQPSIAGTVLPLALFTAFASSVFSDEHGFEANEGQAGAEAEFLFRTGRYRVYLESTAAATFVWAEGKDRARAVRMAFRGAKSNPVIRGLEPRQAKSNYFIGDDPEGWRVGVEHFGAVRYDAVYPGIDLVYYDDGNGRLEFDLILAPGAEPDRIVLSFDGADGVALDDDQNVVAEAGGNELILRRPVVYQEARDGGREAVAGRYILGEGETVHFVLDEFDRSQQLVIDPIVEFATYLGGSTIDEIQAATVDGTGNIYLVGTAASFDFPRTPGSYSGFAGFRDAFIVKMNRFGALLFSTFLGGSNTDSGYGIAVDGSGNIYVTGYTYQGPRPFPTTPGAFQTTFKGIVQDAFVSKLDATGSTLVYSTFLGGRDTDAGYDIAVDAAGNAYVAGQTINVSLGGPYLDFPTTMGSYQPVHGGGFTEAFLTKLNTAGTALVYSTFLGGLAGERAWGVAVDEDGEALVTGLTSSSDFPTTPGAVQTSCGFFISCTTDAFVSKFNASGSDLVFSTFLGGAGEDEGLDIAVDAEGNAFVAGKASDGPVGSAPFPTTMGAFQTDVGGAGPDAFVTKLSPAGTTFIYSTVVGPPYAAGLGKTEFARAIAIDARGLAYVTGQTNSENFFLSPGAIQETYGGGFLDAFALVLNESGSGLVYSSYWGGSGSDEGYGVGVDGAGSLYVAGVTESDDLGTKKAFQSTNHGIKNSFVVKINDPNPAAPFADLDFFTLDPCRAVDTRNAVGALGGPALAALTDRELTLSGVCGIPPTAKGLSVNVAVTGSTAPGNLRLHAGGSSVPLISTINYVSGQTRSNNAVVQLSATGQLAVYADQTSGVVHFILDVNGYFE